MDKRKIFLVFWLVGMIFPLNLIWKISPVVRRVLNALISSELTHVFLHMLLFAGFTFLLLHIFDLSLTWRTAMMLVGCVLAVGLAQEFFQLQVKGRGFSWPEVFDLGVDQVGGAFGWLVYRFFQRYRRYFQIMYFILREA